MKEILTRIVAHEELSRDEMRQILLNITQEKYPETQVTALIMGLQMRGITVEELLGFRDGILETGVPADLSEYKPIDIVGTGGDGKNTFNISTCACFVVAGAGYKVAKHGSYAATSVSGASNVIEGHGVKLTNDISVHRRNLDQIGITYLHAPLFARAMKYVASIRKAIQIPTCFNLLGPIVNPAKPTYQMLGVSNLNHMRLYNSVFQKIGIGYCIVNSLDGYDEISLTGDFKITSNHMEKVFSPADIKLDVTSPDDLSGGKNQTREDAVAVFDRVLRNEATKGQIDVVVANAAFAIHTMDSQKSIDECVAMARESLVSGKAYAKLQKFVELNS